MRWFLKSRRTCSEEAVRMQEQGMEQLALYLRKLEQKRYQR
jgi:hypothetical protein